MARGPISCRVSDVCLRHPPCPDAPGMQLSFNRSLLGFVIPELRQALQGVLLYVETLSSLVLLRKLLFTVGCGDCNPQLVACTNLRSGRAVPHVDARVEEVRCFPTLLARSYIYRFLSSFWREYVVTMGVWLHCRWTFQYRVGNASKNGKQVSPFGFTLVSLDKRNCIRLEEKVWGIVNARG